MKMYDVCLGKVVVATVVAEKDAQKLATCLKGISVYQSDEKPQIHEVERGPKVAKKSKK